MRDIELFDIYVTYMKDGRTVFTVRGEIDLQTAQLLEGAVDAHHLGRRRPGDILLDLASVTFMDSTGISVLLRLRRVAAVRGQHIRVIAASATVREVFTLTGLAERFDVKPYRHNQPRAAVDREPPDAA